MRTAPRSLLAASLLAAALAVPWGCDDGDDGPIRPQSANEPCDTDAACSGGLICCFAPGTTEGLCKLSCDDCGSDADCEQMQPPGAVAARCCTGSCTYVIEGEGGELDLCVDDADCDADYECNHPEGSSYGECIGLCYPKEGGTGGMGAGGMGAGGMGGSGGSGPAIAPHSVKDGTPETTAEGCLSSAGNTALPVRLIFDQTLSGPTTIVVSGSLTPVPQGPGLSGASLVQTCVGGVETMAGVSDCPLSRLELNTYQSEAALALLDAQFNELDKLPWTPGTPPQEFEVTVVADPTAGSLSSTLVIDGATEGTVQTTSLPSPAGDVLSVLFSQAQICGVSIVP